jgi:hypothetical protein
MQWIAIKQDKQEDEEDRFTARFTADELMILAKNRFDAMTDRGQWNAPTKEEKYVALEGKLELTFKNIKKEINTKFKGGKHQGNKQKAGGKGAHPKTWKKPKGNNKKEKMYNGYTWYWCGKETGGNCEKWRAHKPKECQWTDKPPSPEERSKRKHQADTTSSRKSADKKLKIARAYVAKLEKQKRNLDDNKSSSDSDDE